MSLLDDDFEFPDEPWHIEPEDLNDTRLAQAARERRVLMISVPENRLTRELCLIFISAAGANLRFVPCAIRNAAFDREAVMLDAEAFGYLDAGEKTEKLLIEAINESENFDYYTLGEEWAIDRGLLTTAVIDAANVKFGAVNVSKIIGKRKDDR